MQYQRRTRSKYNMFERKKYKHCDQTYRSDTIKYLDKSERPGLLLALDYKAAFDTISKEYILWAFKRFSFGENFLKWMEMLMNNTESCINYMGNCSEMGGDVNE